MKETTHEKAWKTRRGKKTAKKAVRTRKFRLLTKKEQYEYLVKRDGNKCQLCRKTAKQQKRKHGHKFHIHHIDLNENNTKPENLIILCNPCHSKTNTMQYGPELMKKCEKIIKAKYKN